MRVLISLACLLLCALPSPGAGKENESGVSFHLETNEGGNQKMVFKQVAAGKERFFHRTPEIATRDVVAFSPFPSEDEGTYGVVVKLDPRAGNRLKAVTAANVGRWLIAVVNGRAVDVVVIDQQITDGMLVIWKGVTLQEVKAFDKLKPRFGEDKKAWKKRLRDS